METLKTECSSCRGTGLYSGMCEGDGVAVVCITCAGTGCETISYKPFERRRGKQGIHTVRRSRGSFISAGVGPVGNPITYQEFQAGKMP